MKNLLSGICVCVATLALLCGCAGMSGGKNPWAPPEKQKPMEERWAEAEKKEAANREAAPVQSEDPVTVAESREIAEVVDSSVSGAEKFAVAFRLGGIRVPVKKGNLFALRGKDLALHGVARLDVIDGDVLGFLVIHGEAYVGDMVTIPGEKLLAEMQTTFVADGAPLPIE